jgi:hypothetical protein
MPTPQQPNDAVKALRLTDNYMGTTARIRATLVKQVEALWLASPDYRDGDIANLVARLVPMVQAGQLQLANLTSVYLAQQATLLRGIPYAPARVDRAAMADIRGVPDREVFRRPAVTMYTELKAGKNMGEAVQAGAARLVSITGTHLQLAKTTQAQKSFEASGATFFRRVLSGSENCKICVLAATQRYRVAIKPAVHPGCDCGVAELHPKENPGKTIDPALLSAVTELESKDGKLDPRDLITIHEHGELGPVLTWRKHAFTGPAALEDF